MEFRSSFLQAATYLLILRLFGRRRIKIAFEEVYKEKSRVYRAISSFTVAFLCYVVFSLWLSHTLGRVGSGSGRNLWVSGLSSSTRATDLKNLFSKYGKVRSIYVK